MDPYIIIFAALAVVICLCLYSVLGQRTGSERPFRISAFAYRLAIIAAVLGTVKYVAYKAKWYAAIEARVTPITRVAPPPSAATPSSWAYYSQWHFARRLHWPCLISIGRPKNRANVTT